MAEHPSYNVLFLCTHNSARSRQLEEVAGADECGRTGDGVLPAELAIQPTGECRTSPKSNGR